MVRGLGLFLINEFSAADNAAHACLPKRKPVECLLYLKKAVAALIPSISPREVELCQLIHLEKNGRAWAARQPGLHVGLLAALFKNNNLSNTVF